MDAFAKTASYVGYMSVLVDRAEQAHLVHYHGVDMLHVVLVRCRKQHIAPLPLLEDSMHMGVVYLVRHQYQLGLTAGCLPAESRGLVVHIFPQQGLVLRPCATGYDPMLCAFDKTLYCLHTLGLTGYLCHAIKTRVARYAYLCDTMLAKQDSRLLVLNKQVGETP